MPWWQCGALGDQKQGVETPTHTLNFVEGIAKGGFESHNHPCHKWKPATSLTSASPSFCGSNGWVVRVQKVMPGTCSPFAFTCWRRTVQGFVGETPG